MRASSRIIGTKASSVGFPTPPTSGLLLNLDAGNPASYSGSGSTWNDISGAGRNCTFPAGITYTSAGQSSYFSLPGNSDSARFSQSAGSNGSYYDIVIGMWVDSSTQDLGAVFLPTNLSDKSFRLEKNGTTSWRFRPSPDANDWQIDQTSLTAYNNVYNISAYMNYGQWYIIRSYGNNANFSRPFPYGIGAGAYPGRAWGGRINFFLGYDRQLTTQEVTDIFNMYKARLGIS